MEELRKKIYEQGEKIDAIYESIEKVRKYFLIVIWVSLIAFIIPLIAIIFILPSFLESYLGAFSGLL
jgi:type IV secretory pathway component VirB8